MILRLLASCFYFISPLGVMQILFILYQLDTTTLSSFVSMDFSVSSEARRKKFLENSCRFEAAPFRFRKYTSLVSYHLRQSLDYTILRFSRTFSFDWRTIEFLYNTTNVNVSRTSRSNLVSNVTFYFLRRKLLTSFRAHLPVSRGLVNFRGLSISTRHH